MRGVRTTEVLDFGTMTAVKQVKTTEMLDLATMTFANRVTTTEMLDVATMTNVGSANFGWGSAFAGHRQLVTAGTTTTVTTEVLDWMTMRR